MRTYRYKNDNGDWIKSIYPKPTENEEIIANGIITSTILVGLIYFLIKNTWHLLNPTP